MVTAARRGPLRWWLIGIAIVVVLVVIVTVTVQLILHRDDGTSVTVQVGTSGGRVGPGGALGELDVPAGAVPETTDVRFAGSPDAPASTLGNVARPLGTPVDISPQRALPGATVRLPISTEDLPDGTTSANAFIAVYNTTLAMWVPLETRYAAASGQLTAPAPHFSLFGTFVTIAKAVGGAVLTGLHALGVTGVVSALKDMFGEQKNVSCPHRAANWVVTSSVRELAGTAKPGPGDKASCIEPQAGGGEMRLRSTLRVPYDVQLPTGVTSASPGFDDDLDFVSWIGAKLGRATGAAYVPPLGRTALTLPASAVTPGTDVTVQMRPNALALAMGVILGLLGVIPAAHVFIQELRASQTFRATIVRLSSQRLTVTTFFQQLTVAIRAERKVAKPDKVVAAELIAGGVDCLGTVLGSGADAAQAGTAEALVKTAVTAAKKCAGLATEAWDRLHPKDVIHEFAGVIVGFPDAVQALGSVWDAIRTGVTHLGGTFTVTASHQVLDRLRSANWAAIGVRHIDCSGNDENRVDDYDLNRVAYGDVNGDGSIDAVVPLACYYLSGPSSVELVAFDGASDPSDPAVIGVLLKASAGISEAYPVISGQTIRFSGSQYRGGDPACCPSLRYSQRATWNGSGFDLSTPAVS